MLFRNYNFYTFIFSPKNNKQNHTLFSSHIEEILTKFYK
jgi:hypothetical protein